jgi:transcription-repair coupling factor (superfamily II helicase)
MNTIPDKAELLIVSPTPQNLERDDLWFAENLATIKKALLANPWWRNNALLIERDLAIKPSLLIRRLMDMGYERAGVPAGRGIFAVHGGVVDVWPVNERRPYAIEFSGNSVSAIIARQDIYTRGGGVPPPRAAKKTHTFIPGGYVVHTDHGIGIFRGMQAAAPGADTGDFYTIEYAPPGPGRAPDILLVPADQHERLTPYVGLSTPVIHRLGGALWSRTRRKVREDAEKTARALFELYHKRHGAMRPAYAPDTLLIDQLHATFRHEETPDQHRAERDIMADLARERPMDRVLVGDVGFGKTEVAIRAAAAVISAGRQVAVLSPTTVLAAQHERTFRDRLEQIAVRVDALSRLTAPEQAHRVVRRIADGSTDCVVGTSRLLSSDITFKNLGLVIIDEEQRFGVRQKERCKELRAEVDVLSLSATPIPRTLSLALAKLRDISRIDTPPQGRVPIATSVLPHTPKIIRDAITFEMARGGQIYFLHNRIETIGMIRERLVKLFQGRGSAPPRIGIIHGRMSEAAMMRIMEDFRSHAIDILLATTIIENGLDISSANTLIVDDATRLGLAQAHQLRGRIGRGETQAFAYFLYRPRRLTEKGARRLDALKEYAELGAGYDIALRDLEIRGAGNVFGREQSGAINKVGLNLYCQMIADAVDDLPV